MNSGFDMPIDGHPIPRRELWWMFFAGVAAVAVAAELPLPQRREPRLPDCEALPSDFSGDFSGDFGAGLGMQCKISDKPASPKLVIQAAPPSVAVGRPDL
jgi:hypothetical protein